MKQTYTLTGNGWTPKLGETIINYLDGYSFVGEFEILGAIEDYYRNKYGEKVFYSDLVYFQELAKQYMELRNLSFNE